MQTDAEMTTVAPVAPTTLGGRTLAVLRVLGGPNRTLPWTVREVVQAARLSSTSVATYHLDRLHDLGLIERTPTISRSIVVSERGRWVLSRRGGAAGESGGPIGTIHLARRADEPNAYDVAFRDGMAIYDTTLVLIRGATGWYLPGRFDCGAFAHPVDAITARVVLAVDPDNDGGGER